MRRKFLCNLLGQLFHILLITQAALFSYQCNADTQSGVFYLSIFGGSFPVPNRYLVVPNEPNDDRLNEVRLRSPAIPGKFQNLSEQEQVSLLSLPRGYIRVGRLAKGEAYPPLPKNLVPEMDKHLHGLRISVYSTTGASHNQETEKLLSVLIRDDSAYLTIVDEDPTLWQRLLSQFFELQGLEYEQLSN